MIVSYTNRQNIKANNNICFDTRSMKKDRTSLFFWMLTLESWIFCTSFPLFILFFFFLFLVLVLEFIDFWAWNMNLGAEERLLVNEDEEDDYNNNNKRRRRIWEESKRVWAIAFPAMVCRVTTYGAYVVSQASFGHISQVDLAAYALVQTILVRFSNGILVSFSFFYRYLCYPTHFG